MNEITNANIQATGGNINAQINECISLINEINEYLPMDINDISVETVTQTSYGNENPSITIEITPPSLSSDAYVTYAKPISNQTNTPSGSPNGSPNLKNMMPLGGRKRISLNSSRPSISILVGEFDLQNVLLRICFFSKTMYFCQ